MSPLPPQAAAPKLIVALDLASPDAARRMVETIGDAASFYKIGMELAYGGGLSLVEELAASGRSVFLDLKLHDIPITVEKAVANVARLGAVFLTVHAYPQTMAAARRGAQGSPLKILGVTVMTSYDDADLREAGYASGVEALVLRRARQALEAGIDGLILSGRELGAVRAEVGAGLLLVTPGVRPAGAALGDQKRVMTPTEAIRAGADHLVVGRPIVAAPDPRAAALAIGEEIAAAAS